MRTKIYEVAMGWVLLVCVGGHEYCVKISHSGGLVAPPRQVGRNW